MNDKLSHIFQTYFSNERNEIHFLGNPPHINRLAKWLENLKPFDHPDAYARLEDEVLLFEHFEFDSSANNKKGSQQRRSEATENRAFDAVVPTEAGALHHGTIAADYSIENYKKNLETVFCKHYNEIPEYKRSLREKGIITDANRVITAFFIEDTTILGNIYETKDETQPWKPIVLPFCDFFIDLFENSPDVEIALCASWYPSEYCLWYIDRTLIQEYRDQMIETKSVEIINFDPLSIGVKISIPDEKLQNNREQMNEHKS